MTPCACCAWPAGAPAPSNKATRHPPPTDVRVLSRMRRPPDSLAEARRAKAGSGSIAPSGTDAQGDKERVLSASGTVSGQALVHQADNLVQRLGLQPLLLRDAADEAVDALDVLGAAEQRARRG